MPAQPAAQEPRRGEHHRDNLNNEDQMDEINVIFEGNLSITLKTQGKKLKREIRLAQRIEPNRRMKWFETDISFGPEDSNQQWGFTKPHREEDIHRDGAQFIRPNPGA
jgi:hypothetical protein